MTPTRSKSATEELSKKFYELSAKLSIFWAAPWAGAPRTAGLGPRQENPDGAVSGDYTRRGRRQEKTKSRVRGVKNRPPH